MKNLANMSNIHQFYHNNPSSCYNQPEASSPTLPAPAACGAYEACGIPQPLTPNSAARYGANGHESRYSMASGSMLDQSQTQQYQMTSCPSVSQIGSDMMSRSVNTNSRGGGAGVTNNGSQTVPQYYNGNNSFGNVTTNTAATLTTVSTSAIVPNSVTSAPAPTGYLSEVEAAILRSTVPINLNETEEITVNGQRGIWANRSEVYIKKKYFFPFLIEITM